MSSFPPQRFPSGPADPNDPDFLRRIGADPLRPARRAAILMWVIGGLGIVFGLCGVGVAAIMTPQMLLAGPDGATIEKMMTQEGMSFETYKQAAMAVAIVIGAAAALTVVMAFFVRRGGRGAIIASLVGCGLAAGFLALGVIKALMAGIIPSGCLFAACLGGLGLLGNWLWQADQAAPIVAAMRSEGRLAPPVGGGIGPMGAILPTAPPEPGHAARRTQWEQQLPGSAAAAPTAAAPPAGATSPVPFFGYAADASGGWGYATAPPPAAPLPGSPPPPATPDVGLDATPGPGSNAAPGPPDAPAAPDGSP